MVLQLLSVALLVLSFIGRPISSPQVQKTQAELPIVVDFPEVSKLPEVKTALTVSKVEIKKALKVLSATSDIEAVFSKYSSDYGVDKNLLKKIADCESHFHTSSVNGDYGGMFQFSSGTWTATRNQMGADTNPDLRFSGEEAIKTAAFKISRGGAGAWPACSKL